jgi:hypothetical protein
MLQYKSCLGKILLPKNICRARDQTTSELFDWETDQTTIKRDLPKAFSMGEMNQRSKSIQ